MVEDIASYRWSSYRHNALDETDKLITEHDLYKDLGATIEQRYKQYKDMFKELDITKQQDQITKTTLAGEVYGTNGFHNKISGLISRATKLTSHGGDRKSERYRYQAG